MDFSVRTSVREELVDITAEVQRAVSTIGVTEGAALVFCRHTTAAVTINENADPDVQTDMVAGFERIAPRRGAWKHAEGNSDGHIKSSLVGPSLLVPIGAGQLRLGRWQGIYLCEFDGPRTRIVDVTVLPGTT